MAHTFLSPMSPNVWFFLTPITTDLVIRCTHNQGFCSLFQHDTDETGCTQRSPLTNPQKTNCQEKEKVFFFATIFFFSEILDMPPPKRRCGAPSRGCQPCQGATPFFFLVTITKKCELHSTGLHHECTRKKHTYQSASWIVISGFTHVHMTQYITGAHGVSINVSTVKSTQMRYRLSHVLPGVARAVPWDVGEEWQWLVIITQSKFELLQAHFSCTHNLVWFASPLYDMKRGDIERKGIPIHLT